MTTDEPRFNIIEFMKSRQPKHEYTEEQTAEIRQLAEDAICKALKFQIGGAPFFQNGELMPWGVPGKDDIKDDEDD